MKILLQIIFMLITSVCISCNDSEAIAGKPEAKIAQFTLQCGGTYYRGNINDEKQSNPYQWYYKQKGNHRSQLSIIQRHLPDPQKEMLGNRTTVHRDKQRQSANLRIYGSASLNYRKSQRHHIRSLSVVCLHMTLILMAAIR